MDGSGTEASRVQLCSSNLVDVVQLEVLQQQQQDGRDGLHDDLLVSVDIHAELHALQHRRPAGVKGSFIVLNAFYFQVLWKPDGHLLTKIGSFLFCIITCINSRR